jgi:hypothetical protein
MRSGFAWVGYLGLMLIMTLGVVGCGGKSKNFTPEEFGTVTKDMPEAKVIEILGSPKDTLESLGTRRLFWTVNDKYYSISFTDGKVNAPMVHANREDYEMMKGLMKMAKEMGNK